MAPNLHEESADQWKERIRKEFETEQRKKNGGTGKIRYKPTNTTPKKKKRK